MLNDLFEIFLGRSIIRFFGLHTRYFFFKLIRKKKTKAYLSGDVGNLQTRSGQDFFNALVGMPVFVAIAFLIVYIVFGFLA